MWWLIPVVSAFVDIIEDYREFVVSLSYAENYRPADLGLPGLREGVGISDLTCPGLACECHAADM